jgi:23S rRNA (cytidine1920-2'-O)/16S rRNA (cytidine1409-2'-O)-methyltransferase
LTFGVESVSESRLDAALADRGLARSRTHAARLIADGLVTVDGRPVLKASFKVDDGRQLAVAETDHYVSRAAHKLLAALDAFQVPVAGRVALDVGASTGGFSQVLLERGASRVVALDVGHGQLAPAVRSDARVTAVEGFNARFMTADSLAAAAGGPVSADLVVADLSFISLPTVLPALVGTVGLAADYVLLVKPQFEVGRSGIREGIVRQGGLRTDAVNGVLWAAWDLRLPTAGIHSSPIAGTNGNQEYLVWLSAKAGTNPTEWSDGVSAMTEGT